MRKLNYNYYFTKEDELEKDQMWKYIEDQKQLDLKIVLDDLESGEVFEIEVKETFPQRNIILIYDTEYPQSIAAKAFLRFLN